MTSITNLQRKFDKLLFFYLFIRVGNFSQLFTNLITHKLTNLKTHHLITLKGYNIFYKTHVVPHSILAKKDPKNKQIGTVFSPSRFFFCPFFAILPAFCTI